MRWNLSYILIISLLVALSGCRSSFEKVRVSTDPAFKLTKAHEYYEAGEFRKAQMLYEQIIPDYRGKPETEEIFYRYAYTHYEMEQYLLAAHYFKNFANTFTTSEHREEAEYMSAYAKYLLSPIWRLDQSETDEAIDELQSFVNTYPDSERVMNCNKLIDELRAKLEKKAIEKAKLYYNLRQYQAALASFDAVLQDYPDTPLAEEMRYLMVRSSQQLAVHSIFNRKQERFENARDIAELYMRRHSHGDRIAEVRAIYNDINKELEKLRT